MIKRIRLIVFVLFVMAQPAFAQEQAVNDSETEFSPSIGLSASYSPTSFRFWGTIKNTQQFYFSVMFNHTRFSIGSADVQLGSELIVAGSIRFPMDGIDGPRERRTGYGLVPVNVHVPLTGSVNTPFITTSAGFIVTDISFPNDLGSRFNYIIDIGAGYQFTMAKNRIIQAGYKLHHLSNGNSSIENPGIDSHMFFMRILFDL